jgi:serine/threonine protein kinase
MAPEQLRGTPLPASDQYALAVMNYEWLCGEPPFRGSDISVCVQQVADLPRPLRERAPSITLRIERVVLKALEKDPGRRFAYVLEFASALKQAILAQG